MSEKVFVHSTAEVDRDAKIGEGTKVWNNAQVRERATIGKYCNLGKDCYVDNCVTIGDRCKVQNGVYVFYGVTLEDDVFVGPNVSFTNDKVPRAFNDEWEVKSTVVKKGASIGANATIICGVTIGEYAMVAAGAVVTKDVEPYTLVMGVPAKFYSYIDKMGNKVKNENSNKK